MKKQQKKVTIKPNWIAKSEDGDYFLIKRVDNSSLFPVTAVMIHPESKDTVIESAMPHYTFDQDGFYFADQSFHGHNLVDSRPLKNGERFRISYNNELYEFLDIHDLKGIFKVIIKHSSEIDRTGWYNP